MSTLTSNLSLTKPGLSDNVSISVLNDNFDKIDGAIGALESVKVTLVSSGWNATAPYYYEVNVTGMTSDWVPGQPTYDFGSTEPTAEQLEAALEEFGKIKMIVSSTGKLKFVAPSDKPTANVSLIVPAQIVKE